MPLPNPFEMLGRIREFDSGLNRRTQYIFRGVSLVVVAGISLLTCNVVSRFMGNHEVTPTPTPTPEGTDLSTVDGAGGGGGLDNIPTPESQQPVSVEPVMVCANEVEPANAYRMLLALQQELTGLYGKLPDDNINLWLYPHGVNNPDSPREQTTVKDFFAVNRTNALNREFVYDGPQSTCIEVIVSQ